MLSELQCNIIEKALNEDVEPRKVAAYLCLHMGLMLGEVAALRIRDVDLEAASLTLRETVIVGTVLSPLDEVRILPMPPHVVRFVEKYMGLYEDGDCFLFTGGKTVPSFHHMQNILTTICIKYKVAETLSASDLRNAFIRRCILSGVDLYSICAYVGIKQPNVIAKRFAEYLVPRYDGISVLEQFSADYEPLQEEEPEPEPEPVFIGPKRMNLLILGAGGQGHVVKETAKDIGVFDEIAFLDDNLDIEGVIGSLSSYEAHVNAYPMAFVALGDNHFRCALIEQLESAGFVVPVLRHPSATISPTVKAGAGTIFEAKVIVNASVKIGKGVILASACVIDHGTVIHDYVHVDVGAMVKKGSVIEAFTKVKSGSVFETAFDQ